MTESEMVQKMVPMMDSEKEQSMEQRSAPQMVLRRESETEQTTEFGTV
jgi:hypothetical protein